MYRINKEKFKRILEEYAGYVARGDFEEMFNDMVSKPDKSYDYSVLMAIYNILEKRNKISKYMTKIPKFGMGSDDLTGTTTITIPAHWDISRLGKYSTVNDGRMRCMLAAETVIFEPDCRLTPGANIENICDSNEVINLILPKYCERLHGIDELDNIEYIYIPKGFKGRFSVGDKSFKADGEKLHIGMQKETIADIQVPETELEWFKRHVIILDEGEIMP